MCLGLFCVCVEFPLSRWINRVCPQRPRLLNLLSHTLITHRVTGILRLKILSFTHLMSEWLDFYIYSQTTRNEICKITEQLRFITERHFEYPDDALFDRQYEVCDCGHFTHSMQLHFHLRSGRKLGLSYAARAKSDDGKQMKTTLMYNEQIAFHSHALCRAIYVICARLGNWYSSA